MISVQLDSAYRPQGTFSTCDVAYGLFAGPDRDERKALRRAERAERTFRRAKGYEDTGVVARLLRPFR